MTLAALGVLGLAYFTVAYFALPTIWKHYEHQKDLAPLPALTHTAQGIPGDPINIGLIGTKEDIVCAMHEAGWYPADPITFRTSLSIVGSVVLDRPYPAAPISALYYLGEKQVLAFEKPNGKNADRRDHVRLWPVLENGEEERPVWLGAVTFDRGVGISHYTGAVTHHIAPNIDLVRGELTNDLNSARLVQAIYQVSGIGPTINGRNGEGDVYFTDGDIWISRLVESCTKRSAPAVELANPPIIALKNAIWKGVTSLAPGS
ncbi:MAG TPA: LssY C-terminal domain-containing protein [Xanthobacteraceae bacterium]|nr:LssY C-terminal domain-containing protein [Xanthobacteraceae bacterium]